MPEQAWLGCLCQEGAEPELRPGIAGHEKGCQPWHSHLCAPARGMGQRHCVLGAVRRAAQPSSAQLSLAQLSVAMPGQAQHHRNVEQQVVPSQVGGSPHWPWLAVLEVPGSLPLCPQSHPLHGLATGLSLWH